jgi:hypothetical protein
MQWHEPMVQAAMVYAAGYILAAVIAAACAALIGQQFINRRRLTEKLELARQDILFLLEVEREHCAMHKDRDGESNKIRVRRLVRDKGQGWSGRFTSPDT